MKKSLIIFLLITLGSNAFPQAISAVAPTGQTLYFGLETFYGEHRATVRSPQLDGYYEWQKPTGYLVIPSSINYNGITYTVTNIGSMAFSCCTGLTGVSIPNTVRTIGDNAFYQTGLTAVNIPNSVTSIGHSAFKACPALMSVTIPNSVTSIGSSVFEACPALMSITIPDSLTTIGNRTFAYCTGLSSVTIPNSITSIGEFAFMYCTSLSTIRSLASAAPILSAYDPFLGVSTNTEIHILCGSLSSYSSQWNHFNSFIEGFSFSATSADENMGHVDVLTVPTCQNNFSALVYASPAPNYQFAGWSDTNSSNPRGLTLTTDTSIIAYFIEIQQTQYSLNVYSNNPLMGNVSGSGTFNEGATATIFAIANNGFQFTHWQDSNTDNPRNITVTDNANYMAFFSAIPLIHDTINIYDTFYVYIPYAVHDTTIINNYIHDTTTVTLFDTIIITQYDTLMVTLIDTVTVTEQLTYHTLHVMSANNSQGFAAGNGTFPDGTNVEIAAIPIEGNRFVQWNDGSTDNPRTITVSSNMSFAASFEPADVAINSVEGSEYFITTSHNMISVIGATGERIRLFDTLGRQLTVSNNAADIQTFAVPATGAYFIQIGNRPARKVVVVR